MKKFKNKVKYLLFRFSKHKTLPLLAALLLLILGSSTILLLHHAAHNTKQTIKTQKVNQKQQYGSGSNSKGLFGLGITFNSVPLISKGGNCDPSDSGNNHYCIGGTSCQEVSNDHANSCSADPAVYHCMTYPKVGLGQSCTPGYQQCSQGTCKDSEDKQILADCTGNNILGNSNSGTCQNSSSGGNNLPIGSSCTPGQHQCASNLTCKRGGPDANTCVNYIKNAGEACGINYYYCASGKCDIAVSDPAPQGKPNDSNYGFCLSTGNISTTPQKLNAGQTCKYNNQCISNSCIKNFSAPKYTCAASATPALTNTPTPTSTPALTPIVTTTLTPTPTSGPCDGKDITQKCTAIWTDKDSYAPGDPITISYSSSIDGIVTITDTQADGESITINGLPNVVSGQGNSIDRVITSTTPPGTEHLSLSILGGQVGGNMHQSAKTSFTVTAVTPTPTDTPTPTPNGGNNGGGTPTDTPSANATVTPVTSATSTPVPPNNGTPTDTPPSATSTPNPNAPKTFAKLTLAVETIKKGYGGQDVKFNSNPNTTTRTATVYIYNASDNPANTQPLVTVSDNVTYNAATGNFTNNKFSLGQNITHDGNYKVFVKTNQTLRASLGTIALRAGDDGSQNNLTPSTVPTLLVGDLNGDNTVDLTDYNELIACFPDTLLDPGTCDPSVADLNDKTPPADNNLGDNFWQVELTILLTNFGKNGD